MFNFHKPKIYRSSDGCCICRAKSSSSRFTDSKRYETEFNSCFRTLDKREGDICNACVLLVKRWKKLPKENNSRHWNHVVDARAGPGTRSSCKIRRGSPFKHNHRTRAAVSSDFYPDSPGQDSGDVSDQSLSDDEFDSDIQPIKTSRLKPDPPTSPSYFSSFLDPTYWKKKKVCCGIIFVGSHGAVMIDPQLLKPCIGCRSAKSNQVPALQRSDSVDTDSLSGDNDDRGDNSDGSTGEINHDYSDAVTESDRRDRYLIDAGVSLKI